MSGAVILARFSTLEEALVVRGLLLANDIPVASANRHHAGNDWGSISAFGGVQLLVPEDAYDVAREIVVDAVNSVTDSTIDVTAESDRRQIRFRAATMLIIYFGVPILVIAAAFLAFTLYPLTIPIGVEDEYILSLRYAYGWAQQGRGLSEPFLRPEASAVFLMMALMVILVMIDSWKLDLNSGHVPEGHDLPSFDL